METKGSPAALEAKQELQPEKEAVSKEDGPDDKPKDHGKEEERPTGKKDTKWISSHPNDGLCKYGGSRDVVGYGAHPPHPKWPRGAKVALNFIINLEGGGEPCLLHGDHGNAADRDLNMETMYDYGPRSGFWRLHRLFTKKKIPVTVFAVGMALQRNPAICHALVEATDWEIASKGYREIDYRNVDELVERDHLKRTVAIHRRLLGERPAGFMQGQPSINTRKLLVHAGGFKYDSDSYADDLPYWSLEFGARPHLIIPSTTTETDLRYENDASGHDFGQHLKDTLRVLVEEGRAGSPKMMTVVLHCRLARPCRMTGLMEFVDYAKSFGSTVWCCTREEIADVWHEKHPPKGADNPIKKEESLGDVVVKGDSIGEAPVRPERKGSVLSRALGFSSVLTDDAVQGSVNDDVAEQSQEHSKKDGASEEGLADHAPVQPERKGSVFSRAFGSVTSALTDDFRGSIVHEADLDEAPVRPDRKGSVFSRVFAKSSAALISAEDISEVNGEDPVVLADADAAKGENDKNNDAAPIQPQRQVTADLSGGTKAEKEQISASATVSNDTSAASNKSPNGGKNRRSFFARAFGSFRKSGRPETLEENVEASEQLTVAPNLDELAEAVPEADEKVKAVKAEEKVGISEDAAPEEAASSEAAGDDSPNKEPLEDDAGGADSVDMPASWGKVSDAMDASESSESDPFQEDEADPFQEEENSPDAVQETDDADAVEAPADASDSSEEPPLPESAPTPITKETETEEGDNDEVADAQSSQ